MKKWTHFLRKVVFNSERKVTSLEQQIEQNVKQATFKKRVKKGGRKPGLDSEPTAVRTAAAYGRYPLSCRFNLDQVQNITNFFW